MISDHVTSPNQIKPGSSAGTEHLDLGDVVRLLRRRRRVILAVAGLFTGLATLAALTLPPQYTAVATLLVEGSDPQVLQSEAVLTTPPQDRPLVATHVALLTSRSFMRAIVKAKDLHEDPEYNPALPGGPRVWDWLETAFAELVESLPPQAVFARSLMPNSTPPSAQKQQEQTVNQLLLQTEAEQTGEAYTIAVRVTSFDPAKAAQLANVVADSYVAGRLESRQGAMKRAVSFLGTRLEELRSRAAASEAAVAEYVRTEGLSQSREDDPVLRQMDELNQQLVLAEIRRAQAEARLQQARELMRSPDGGPGAGLFTSPMLLELRQQAAMLNRKAAEFGTIYGERHPQMTNLRAEVDSVRQREAEEVERIVYDLEKEARVARAEEEQLRSRFEELEVTARQQRGAAVALRELERQAAADRAIYTSFLSRYREVSEQSNLVGPNVTVVSEAQPPTIPSFPRKALLIGGTFGGSLALGLIFAFMAELLDAGLRSARQVERALGIPPLALVPIVPRRGLRRQRLHEYLRANPRSGFADAIRRLKLELLQSNLDQPPRVVLVTSALPGEGKTTLAISLAVAAAEEGQRSVIVDVDLHRPCLRELLMVPKDVPGLVEVLSGEHTLDEALTADPRQPQMHGLVVRRTAANAGALLASQRMAQLLKTLRGRFDLVILDTPPTLAVGDARVLAGLADAVLYVVRWGRTKADASLAGLETLRDAPTTIAGAVLSQVDVKRHAKRVYGDGIQYYRRYAKYYRA
ncbi:MAG: GumC family protein [Gammaproteobacteria bacterium]